MALKPPVSGQLQIPVNLNRRDFSYYNWVIALERPILPFFIYTFTLLILADLFKIWPDARLYAFAVLIPAVAYLLFVWLSTKSLWQKIKALQEPSTYYFLADGYQVVRKKDRANISYDQIKQVLESRKGIYLIRQDGTADILPKGTASKEALSPFFDKKLWRSSSFL
ncbi:MAG: YcxB family protein [Trueperaceae bacterium]|nr:YcxB family protein [Trueperaceae bacterium]